MAVYWVVPLVDVKVHVWVGLMDTTMAVATGKVQPAVTMVGLSAD